MLKHELSQDSLLLSNNPARLQLDTICGFLARSHWAANRPREVIAKSIAHSLCYGVYDGACNPARQVAFARLVTDYSTYAYLCDVFVDEAYRGRGISKWLMEAIMCNPDLASLRRFTLATKDAHGLYEKFGFKALSPEKIRKSMTIVKEGV